MSIPIESLVQRPVKTLPAVATCMEAARLMRDENIGSVVVAEERAPLGMVTDRDLALRVLAEGRNPATVPVGQVMSPYPAFLSNRRSLDEAIATMRRLGVRRLPVVDEHGHLDGILSMDDILAVVARQLGQLSEVVRTDLEPPSP